MTDISLENITDRQILKRTFFLHFFPMLLKRNFNIQDWNNFTLLEKVGIISGRWNLSLKRPFWMEGENHFRWWKRKQETWLMKAGTNARDSIRNEKTRAKEEVYSQSVSLLNGKLLNKHLPVMPQIKFPDRWERETGTHLAFKISALFTNCWQCEQSWLLFCVKWVFA